MAERSSLYQALETLLGDDGPLDSFVTSRRAGGKSWRAIAIALRARTRTEVSHEALRSWFPDRELVTANSTPPGTPRPSHPPTSPRPSSPAPQPGPRPPN